MSRSLDDLSDRMRPLVFEFLARATEAGICLLIVDTLRTLDEHQSNLTRGVSWTTISNHLDGLAFRNTLPGSDAIDVCPYDTYQLHGRDKLEWNADDPVWAKIGRLGEGLGLVWGGRWRRHPDWGHFEHPLAREGMSAGVVSS